MFMQRVIHSMACITGRFVKASLLVVELAGGEMTRRYRRDVSQIVITVTLKQKIFVCHFRSPLMLAIPTIVTIALVSLSCRKNHQFSLFSRSVKREKQFTSR